MACPYPLPKLVLHRVRSSASYFNFQYPLCSLGQPVAAYFLFLVFPSLIFTWHVYDWSLCGLFENISIKNANIIPYYLKRQAVYFQYPLVSLRSASSCLLLIPRLPVTNIYVACIWLIPLRLIWKYMDKKCKHSTLLFKKTGSILPVSSSFLTVSQ